MYNSHPTPPGLQVTREKQQVLYRLYTLVSFFRIDQMNMYVTEHTLQKKYQFEIPRLAKYWYLLIDKHFMITYTRIRELICINLCAWIYMRKRVTLSYMGILLQHSARSFLYKTLRLISMARNTNSAVFNRIAWHQIYHFIIKVHRVKIGNILSGVIKQWRSQVNIQVTWEKAQGYADEHQVYLSFRPVPSTNQTASVTAIVNCVAELRSCQWWMTARQNSWL